ncbi:MAG: menaquinone biosynthesis protein [Bacillota bacterium]
MPGLRLGQVDYVNCLPVYFALEEGLLTSDVEIVKGPPTTLNHLFMQGQLDVTPLSSIEYARHPGKCVILPDLSIAADGRVSSILFFSSLPMTEIEGRSICVTDASATSVVMLKILFDHYYHMDVEFIHTPANLTTMLSMSDGALLIGDQAMQAKYLAEKQGWPLYITDLGEVWKTFTGEKMVYALWVVRSELIQSDPESVDRICRLLHTSRELGRSQGNRLLNMARIKSGLPFPLLEDYLGTIQHSLGEEEQRALITYFDYAYKSGLIEERVRLHIWGNNTGA